MTTFYLEWGGSADLSIDEVWPDGDAPENPTTDDVIAQLKRQGATSEFGIKRVASDWMLDIEDIEVSGPGGTRSLARVLADERRVADETRRRP